LKKILKVLNLAGERKSLIKQCVWSISNFCRSKPAPDYEIMKPCIDHIVKYIYKYDDDTDFLCDACWVLSYMSEQHKKSIRKMLDLKIVDKLLTFLDIQNVHIQLPLLRIVGNIVSGNALQTQHIVDAGALKYLAKTIFHEKKTVRKETCWIISNVAAGTQQQIEALILNGFLPILATVIKRDDPEIQKEAIWAVCNFTSTEK